MSKERKTEQVMAMMTPSQVAALDAWCFRQGIASRSEALRIMLEQALKAEAAGIDPAEVRQTPGGAAE